MFLPCPHCGYLVALILPSTPASSHAGVRCPRCDGVLRVESAATATPVQDHNADAVAATPARAAAMRSHGEGVEPGLTPPPMATGNRVDSTAAMLPADEPSLAAAAAAATAAPSPPRTRTPGFVRRAAARPRSSLRTSWRWYAAIALLALLLAVQLVLAQRRELAGNPRWRPLVIGLCNAVACTVPPWREPGAFTMLARNVQPGSAGVLAVDASFRNDARWPQPWPTLVLTLSDVEGRPVGARAFAPAHYRLRAGNGVGAAEGSRIQPGQIATARLLVREPATGVVAFTFDFK